MSVASCVSCKTVSGRTTPVGGVVYQDAYWMLFLRSQPLLVPGQGFIVLKRHCEHLTELTPAELASLGPMMQRTHQALDQVLKPAKVHFGLYAEVVKHIHLHVLPRMPEMPIGNIPVTLLGGWYELLKQLHLKRPFTDEAVADVAQRLRQTFEAVQT